MRYVHTEEMIDLGGAIKLDENQVLTNDSNFEFLDAIVVRRMDESSAEFAIVGAMGVGESKTVEFSTPEIPALSSDLPMQTARIMRRLVDSTTFPPGTTRLVARFDGSLEGLALSPSASQRTAQTIAVVHLRRPAMADREVDTNLPTDFRAVNRLEDDKPNDSDNKDLKDQE